MSRDQISTIIVWIILVCAMLFSALFLFGLKPEKGERALGWKLIIAALLFLGISFMPFIEK